MFVQGIGRLSLGSGRLETAGLYSPRSYLRLANEERSDTLGIEMFNNICQVGYTVEQITSQ